MKKIIALFIAALMLLFAVSCEKKPEQTTSNDTTSTDAPIIVPRNNETIDGTDLVLARNCADENGVYVVPDGIKFIGENAFSYDTKLKEVVIPAGVTGIGADAFKGCTALTKVTLPSTLVSIGGEAFYGCTALEEISIPASVSSILTNTFYGCESLETVELHEGLKVIDAGAFSYCISLLSIDLPASLETMGSMAFDGCLSLRYVNGLENTKVTSISSYAFMSCRSLRRIALPESTTTIETGAFYGCQNLSEFAIPSGVTSIGMLAMSYTPWYTDNEDEFFIVGDGVLIKTQYNPNSAEEVGTLDLSGLGIKSIGNSCFANIAAAGLEQSYGYAYCPNIVHVIIPEGVTSIGDGAFYCCFNIEDISLPSTLVSIGGDAFYSQAGQMYSMATVSFENCTSLESIGTSAFYGCYGIEEIDLPASVKHIGEDVFTETKASLTFMEEAAAKGQQNVFKIVGDNVLLWTYVSKDATAITIPDGVKYLAGGACIGWDGAIVYDDYENSASNELIKVRNRISNNITSVKIPSSVVFIGNKAFFRLSKITSVTIPDSVVRIGSEAFAWCSALTSVKFGKGLEYLDSYAFNDTALKSVTLPSGLVSIGSGVFYDCGNLQKLVIPDSVKSAGTSIVNGMNSTLTSVEMPKSLRPSVFLIVEIDVTALSGASKLYIKYN